MNFKEALKKFWKLFWKDDSFKGWIFSLVVIIIFIKLIFFPILYLVTGTHLPLAIVESCSMYHNGFIFHDFDSWYKDHESKYSNLGLSKDQFETYSLKNGFSKGDILFILGTDTKKLKVGDIIIFNADQTNPVIHRIVSIREENGKRIFTTYGDNNNGQLVFEKNINENQIIGRASFKLTPYLGWGKLIFYEWFKPKEQRGICIEN